MKVAILGYAGQGQAAYEYWNRDGNELTICDRSTDINLPEDAATQLGDDYLKDLDRFDLLIRTPALHPHDIIAASPNAPDILSKVTTVTNEFFKVCPSRNIIGVTGTKGKGTTSTLITKILEAAGHRVHLGGNIGTPPLTMLKDGIEPEDWVVLELANFQLIDLRHSPHIGVVLMVEPEHMDWHEDFEEYIAAKQQLFINQDEDDIAIFYAHNENSQSVAGASMGVQLPYMAEPGARVEGRKVVIDDTEVCDIKDIKLLGTHNWQNVCAAITAAWQVTQDVTAIKSAISSFTGLPFRIELRGEHRGLKFYNDSFATAPEATMAAIEAIPESKVLILGGYDRGLSLERLARHIKRHEQKITKLVLIGASAGRLTEVLESKGFGNYMVVSSRNMGDIVRTAIQQARHGDAVVLSPGFASFDMFKNFEDRGNKFNESITKL